MAKFCASCGTQVDDNVTNCPNCGAPVQVQAQQQYQQPYQQAAPAVPGQKSKLTAGLLGLFLGGWGVHNFYLGNTTRGVIQIVVSLVTCGIGSLWGFIEGILILTGSINTDANGNPLGD